MKKLYTKSFIRYEAILEGLVDIEELYNLLHSFRRGVWMDEELHKASFIHL
jgi:hypothetical protein